MHPRILATVLSVLTLLLTPTIAIQFKGDNLIPGANPIQKHQVVDENGKILVQKVTYNTGDGGTHEHIIDGVSGRSVHIVYDAAGNPVARGRPTWSNGISWKAIAR